MKKFSITLLSLVLLSTSLLAEDQSTVVDSLTSERVGSCIAIRYSDVKSKKDLYDFFTVSMISSIKLLTNKNGKLYIRIKSEDETSDYIFEKDDRKNILLALQSLINAAYANHGNGAKDKLDVFIDR